MRKWILCLLLIAQTNLVFALEKRNKQANHSLTVAIPCHYVHVKYLKRLLDSYREQTIFPLEIIISISEADKAAGEITELKQLSWPFPVVFLETNERVSPGGNRNRATSLANGQVIVFQDADDVPHKQRLETIKYFFDRYKIHHLIHRFAPSFGCFTQEHVDPKFVTIYELKRTGDAFFYFPRVQFGQCSISKKAAKNISWDSSALTGEDLKFCDTIIHQLGNSFLIDAELVTSETSGLPGLIQQGLL